MEPAHALPPPQLPAPPLPETDGRRQRIGELFEARGSQVWRMLRRLGVAERDADDVCQDVFLTAYHRVPEFAGLSKLETWLYGICLRTAANYRRRASHRLEQLEASPPESATSSGPPDTLLLAQLDRALGALSAPKREVFVLYEIGELEMHEVAVIVGSPLKTCFARLYAARRELRQALEAQESRP
jgi:RNA polymerase sigma-70 factor (ECF subfamily)